jgi:hypothetical protein
MNPITFNLYLSRSPILGRYAQGVYGLRGAEFTPGDLERCVPLQVKRLSDHGWTIDAKPWIAVELSAGALSSGVVSVPAAVRDFLVGRYLLRAEDRAEIGTLVISEKGAGWGLAPLFRRRGGEPGDVLLIVFDPQRGEALARCGKREDVLSDLYAHSAVEEVSVSRI